MSVTQSNALDKYLFVFDVGKVLNWFIKVVYDPQNPLPQTSS